MMVKLALVELSRGTESGISSLEDEFQANYYINSFKSLWSETRKIRTLHMLNDYMFCKPVCLNLQQMAS